MFATVAGIGAQPPTVSLVAAAQRPNDRDTRWTGGLVWVPESCGIGYQLIPWCSDDDPPEHEPDTTAAAVYHKPVVARVAVTCSTVGGGVDAERVRRVTEASTPFLVAREFWEGVAAEADSGYPTPGGGTATNRYLASADADVIGSGGASLDVALGRLEAAALTASRGQRVMLHVPPTLMLRLGGKVTPTTGGWETPLRSVVVTDAGYTGTGPAGQAAGATVWAYATSIVQVRVTPVVVEDALAATVDRAVNSMTVWGNRVFAATWDPCVHLATEITI